MDYLDLDDDEDADFYVLDDENDDELYRSRARSRTRYRRQRPRRRRRWGRKVKTARAHRRSHGSLHGLAGDLRADIPTVELQTPFLARAIAWVLVLGVAAGFAALAVTLWTRDSSEEDKSAAPALDVAAETGPAGWAELYVAEFLAAGQGTEYRLASYLKATNLPALSAKPNSFYASAVSTVSAVEVEKGYWAVVVAAHVLARNAEGDATEPREPATTR